MDIENSEKERSKGRLCYMANYMTAAPHVCQVKGERIVKIYKARGFVEVDKAEYERLVTMIKERGR